jgi:hypothetical protein
MTIRKFLLSSKQFLLSFDRFSIPVSLNFGGKTKFQSIWGTFLSMIIYLFLISYAFRKGRIFLFRLDPQVTTYVSKGHFGSDEFLDLSKTDFQIAVAAFDYNTSAPLNNPSMVEWQIKLDTWKD